MIKVVLLLFFSVYLLSCRSSAIENKLSGCDSLVITFDAPGNNSVSKTVATTEKNAIRKLIQFVDGSETEKYKCGYDGNLIFYKDGEEVLPIVFKYRDNDCRHFLMDINGKLLSTRMNAEAAEFLASLEAGRTWY